MSADKSVATSVEPSVKSSLLQALSILLAVSVLIPILASIRFAVTTIFLEGKPVMLINTFEDYIRWSFHGIVPLLPVLLFLRWPRLAVPLYTVLYFAYSEWSLQRILERNFRTAADFPFSDRWFTSITSAVLAGCALLIAYWLLNKYSKHFKIRIV